MNATKERDTLKALVMSEDKKKYAGRSTKSYLCIFLCAFTISAIKWCLLVGFTLFSLDRFFPTNDNYVWILLIFSIFGLWKALDYGEKLADKLIDRDS